jgi:hypothetical protein
MMTFNRPALFLATLLALALLAGCQLLGGTPPPQVTLPPAATATEAAPAASDTAPPAATATEAAPAASDTPPPTETATATATETAAASATPSPLGPTATATAPPTPDPNEGVGDVVYQDPLNGTGGWFWTFSDEVANFGVDTQRGQLKATMAQANAGWRFTISPDTLRLGNQQVRVTAHTEACGENDEYGLMFRGRTQAAADGSGDEFALYLFKLRCGGAASFQRVQGSETTTLVDWTPSAAINTGAPADNTLMVWMRGSEFRFYVNDEYLFSAQDTTLAEGFFGLYLYDRTAGGMTVYFEGLVVVP